MSELPNIHREAAGLCLTRGSGAQESYVQPLCAEVFHCFLVPNHACSDNLVNNGHSACDLQRLRKKRVPPVCVLEEMGRWCCTHELCANLGPEMIRKRDAGSFSEGRSPDPSRHTAN